MTRTGGAMTPPPRPRPTARLIVLDDADRVLLFQFEDSDIIDPRDPPGVTRPWLFWATPGGGVEPGETYEEAAVRELREETGLTVDALGPCLHEGEKLLVFSEEAVLFQLRFYLVRVPMCDISLDGFNALERSVYRDHRWWTLEELRTTSELVFPEELISMVSRAIAGTSATSRTPGSSK